MQDREGKAQEIQSKQYPTLVEALQQSWKSINPSKTHRLMPVILREHPSSPQTADFCGHGDCISTDSVISGLQCVPQRRVK